MATNPFAARLAEMDAEPAEAAPSANPFAARLAEMDAQEGAPKRDPRGRPYDPRFAPDAEDAAPSRPFSPSARGYDAAVAALKTGAPDRVAPTGLAGLITGEQTRPTYTGEPLTPADTVALNATNLFGAGSAIGGAVNAALRGGSYEDWRQKFEAARGQANEDNPKAKWAGRGLALAAEMAAGGLAGKAVGAGVGALAPGAAETLAAAAKARPVLAGIAGGVGTGAAYGAAGGAGEAASQGGALLEGAIRGAKVGAVTGGVFGGALAKASKLLKRAPQTQVEDIVRAASERALPRKQSALSALFEDADGEAMRHAAAKSRVTPGQVIAENLPALKKLRGKDADTVSAGTKEISATVEALEQPKGLHYAAVDDAIGGGFRAKAPIDALENRAATETEKPWKRVLQQKADALKQQWSSISTEEAKRILMAEKPRGDQSGRDAMEAFARSLPNGQQLTKGELLDVLAGGNARANWADLNPEIRAVIDAMPYKYDGNLKIPSRDLRRALTMSQDEAEKALGTLNATKNARLAALSQEVLGKTMDRTLDAAAKKGPMYAEAVQAIRDTNMRQSTLLRLNESAARKVEKLNLAKPTLGGIVGGHGPSLLSGYEALEAAKHLMHGDIAGAARSAAAAVAAKVVPKAVVGGKRAANDAAAALQRRLAVGDRTAKRLLGAGDVAGRTARAALPPMSNAALAKLIQPYIAAGVPPEQAVAAVQRDLEQQADASPSMTLEP